MRNRRRIQRKGPLIIYNKDQVRNFDIGISSCVKINDFQCLLSVRLSLFIGIPSIGLVSLYMLAFNILLLGSKLYSKLID